ncbi:hypothetical protein HPB49_023540 [Dermacentor silvarum]|uniref:Uncharacterized protein n=1 Tax=Dermacentor silvarum TaxID=543639 RepID=A0ACB8DRL0_DERSI|nr:hypothetical protein HPB49_023540 [Dermacentor silvarum]
MNVATTPPPFLQCPGLSAIPWPKWRHVLQIHVAARDATPKHKKALLFNSLGVEGLNIYFRAVVDRTQLHTDEDGETLNAYEEALTLLHAYFCPEDDEVCRRMKYKKKIQTSAETTMEFLKGLRSNERFEWLWTS